MQPNGKLINGRSRSETPCGGLSGAFKTVPSLKLGKCINRALIHSDDDTSNTNGQKLLSSVRNFGTQSVGQGLDLELIYLNFECGFVSVCKQQTSNFTYTYRLETL